MANNCYFEMKVAGPAAAVEEFLQRLQWKEPYAQEGIGRVFSFDIPNPDEVEKDPATGHIATWGSGDCAWSLRTAVLEIPSRSLVSESERLGLVVEAFSSEPGCQFQEHILVAKGKVLENECVDYEEHWIDGASESYIQEVMKDHNLTRDELMSKLDHNGDFCVGGFDNFGEFEDLFPYFKEERKPALASRIQQAESRTDTPAEPVAS